MKHIQLEVQVPFNSRLKRQLHIDFDRAKLLRRFVLFSCVFLFS